MKNCRFLLSAVVAGLLFSGDTMNLYVSQKVVARLLLRQVKEDVARDRSTTGESAKNDINKIYLLKRRARK